jgi:hypothetical protein
MMKKSKARTLENLTADEVEPPDFCTLTFAVCSSVPSGCGWGGWLLESAYKAPTAFFDPVTSLALEWPEDIGRKFWDEKETEYRTLPAQTQQICPSCGQATFRTEVRYVMRRRCPSMPD